MKPKSPRVAVRAVILHDDKLLLVNAWPNGRSALMCAPGGGVNAGQSLPCALMREMKEETGLDVTVLEPCLINEFHDPNSGFHQVEVFFRCTIEDATLDPAWQDPEGVVTQRRWVTRAEINDLEVKPSSLAAVAWGETGLSYDPLEPIRN
ncbi:NUDIX hydrolase [Donghicola sp.]|jgi:ADP-ribose pyrophosphatase YjhB (NUDIX family)|uniref:NUDIX domain-containing protein n=1 Tax=Donghicola sp. TaxID=1929294 RepID=UPI0025F2D5E5|nr:NUDIX hydrolase [Donghicola sp.]MCT4577853.1 NUDIX hydrolase [Donghicola sp.]